MKTTAIKHILSVCLTALFLSACRLPFLSRQTDAFTPTAAATQPPIPTATPAPRNLTVCLGQEPNTLYPFGGPNAAARSVLAAVYDGPIDLVSYEYQPVALAQLPSIENGDAQIVRTPVQAGGQVVDAGGAVVLLQQGTKVRPAGCRGDDCILTWDGTTPLEMDQMIVTFRMRPELTWADGTPITAEDSVYAFQVASDPAAIADTFLIDRTQTYEAADSTTLQWFGLPGYIDGTYFSNFFQPLPRHLWSQFPAGQLPQIDIASKTPIGWGPFAVTEWIAGDHITLNKNPYYYLAAQGYPKMDSITFRFTPDPDAAVSELIAGRCDILDPSIRLDSHVALLREMQAGEQAKAFFVPGMTIEWLALGINPASYDNGYDTLFQKDRPDIFGDPYTRQGIAYCLDRQSVINNVQFGLSEIPPSYIPVDHPLFDTNLAALPFDTSMGNSLLNQAGWRDTDGNPATPRVAVTVKNVPANTPLQLNYYTSGATQRRQVAEILAASLAQCGIGLNIQYLSQTDLYAPGPDGVLFGRNFDMAEFAMGVNGIEPPCDWFTSGNTPSAQNAYIGTNVSGYKNPEFDTACRLAQLSIPGEQSYIDAYRQTQIIFSNELPAIPLYYRLRVSAARPDICHYDLDASANPLWNVEAFDYGAACNN